MLMVIISQLILKKCVNSMRVFKQSSTNKSGLFSVGVCSDAAEAWSVNAAL